VIDREIEIVQTLLEDVLKMERDIEAACDVGAELDCLLSFTTASRTYEYTRPTMVESDVMNIIGGR
jgi:DNA mismatch repair protein MSH5